MTKTFISCLLMSVFFFSCAHQSQTADKKSKKGEILYSHGTAKLMSQEYPEALDLLLRAAEELPEDTRVFNNLGMAYYFMKRPGTAIQNLQRSLKIDEKNSDARNNLASVLFSQGRYDEAQKHYELIQEDLVYRHQYRIKYNLALIHLKKGNKTKAISLLTQSAQEEENYCAPKYQLGLMYQQTYNYKEALEWFQKASLGTCYAQPAPHFQQAEVLAALNNYEQAKSKYDEIIERFPKSAYATLAQQKLIQLEQASQVSRRDEVRRFQSSRPKVQTPTF